MSFNTNILLANYYAMHGPDDDDKDDDDEEQYTQSDTEQEVFTEPPRPRYARHGLDMIKASNY